MAIPTILFGHSCPISAKSWHSWSFGHTYNTISVTCLRDMSNLGKEYEYLCIKSRAHKYNSQPIVPSEQREVVGTNQHNTHLLFHVLIYVNLEWKYLNNIKIQISLLIFLFYEILFVIRSGFIKPFTERMLITVEQLCDGQTLQDVLTPHGWNEIEIPQDRIFKNKSTRDRKVYRK